LIFFLEHLYEPCACVDCAASLIVVFVVAGNDYKVNSEITSSGSAFQICGVAIGNAYLLMVEN